MKLYTVATLIRAIQGGDLLLDTYSILADTELEAQLKAHAELTRKFPSCHIMGVQVKEVPILQMAHAMRHLFGSNSQPKPGPKDSQILPRPKLSPPQKKRSRGEPTDPWDDE